ncbi:MAG: hypothetical protein Q8L27_04305, partial [archaeon]|nr:hypothetical protein [archaeon]
MESFLNGLGEEKGIRILSKKIHEPKKLAKEVIEKNKYNGEMFSTFSELEIESEQVMNLFIILFKYLPSHMEVISPENLMLDNLDISAITNEVINRIHHYDGIAKAMLIQNTILSKKVEELIVENRNKSVPNITFGNSEEKIVKKKKK